MNVHYHKNFLKHFRQRIAPQSKLIIKFNQRLVIFLNNPANPILKDHQLIGSKIEYRAFSVTGDLRVVYKKVEDGILLYDIGTHNQVY